jgi:3-oxoacyl-[acyl-carrier protein] reductase
LNHLAKEAYNASLCHLLTMRLALVFGGSGSIGQSICENFTEQGSRVVGAGRTNNPHNEIIEWVTWTGDDKQFCQNLKDLLIESKIDSVIWAQGMNCNDDIDDFDITKHLQMYEANVVFILRTLHALRKANLLAKNARLCIISSIWQNIARQTKLSYCITKSALQGLVQSLTIDLGKEGILINAVLPGALDTPMTRLNLNHDQIEKLESLTPLQTLPNLSDVVGLVDFLCSQNNTGITGQFIAADRGFSYARIL